MLNFPKETCLNKMIAKTKFYERANVSSALKNSFVNDIEKITWINKLSSQTLNVESGEISEIEVFHIKLKVKNFNHKIIETIDKSIPYYILYVLEYEGLYQLCIGYKEKNSADSKNKASVLKYFSSQWMSEPVIKVQGNKLDTIYENFITQLSDNQINISDDADLKSEVKKSIEISDLDKEIDNLKKQMKRAKQYDEQIRLNRKIKELQKQKGVINGKNENGNK